MNRHKRLLRVVLVLGAAGIGRAAEDRNGQAEVALQGSYLDGDSNRLADITGIAAKFQSVFPSAGLLTVNLETYGGEGRFRTGENFIDLNGATWYGFRWRLTGGDFRIGTSLVPFPFTNIFQPELSGQGFRIEASSRSRKYALFYGIETLMAGPRVPFRVRVPQTVLGASITDKIGEKLEVGARVIHLSTNPDSSSSYLFAPGQDFSVSTSVLGSLFYRASTNLQFYGEASGAATSGPTPSSEIRSSPFSFTGGPVWKSQKLTIKANYIHQAASYLPVAGYFLGDRAGPHIEAQFKPVEAIEFFGSADGYRNNLANSPNLPTFHSKSASGGTSISLPFRFSASAQLSNIDFSTKQPDAGEWSTSYNRQMVATLGRPIRNHNVHFSYRDFRMRSDGRDERQQSQEIEDIVQFRVVSVGGAVRKQRLFTEQSKDTLFLRGNAQARLGRLSAYAYLEHGDDLANRTVFLTSTFNTTVVGGAMRLSNTWNVQFEASRSRLATELNPENIFLLQNQGAIVTNAVAGLNQWTAYFRLSKSFHWGRGLPAGDLERYTAEQIPIVGAIEGSVMEQRLDGAVVAEGIPVILDDGRVVVTDGSGVFRFPRVAEGRHTVAIARNELPAEYDLGAAPERAVEVRARRVAGAELSVVPLVSLFGEIGAPAGVPLDGVIVRLLPTKRYTTPTIDGRFALHNLGEGEYDLALDIESLPEFAVADRTTAHVSLRAGVPCEKVRFVLAINKPEKPIRRSVEKQ